MPIKLRAFFATPIFSLSIILFKLHLIFDSFGCAILGISNSDAVRIIKEAYQNEEKEK